MSIQLSRFASAYPPIPIPRQSFYTYLVEQDTFDSNHPFTINGQTGNIVTRGQLKERALRLAYGLRNAHKVGLEPLGRGSTAIVVSPATDFYAVMMLGLGAAGIVCALANPAYTAPELAHAITVSRASHVLAHASALPLVRATLASLGRTPEDIRRTVVLVSPEAETPPEDAAGWATLDTLVYDPVPGLPERFDGAAADATAFVYFSSGTTGLSKGVELSHANVGANLAQMRAVHAYFQTNRDVTVTGIPLFHVLGGQTLILFSLLRGVAVVLLPRVVPAEYLACIARYRVSVIITVPPILLMLTNSPLVEQHDLSSVRVLSVGAAPVSPEMMLACERRFARRGWRVSVAQGYGMTELTAVATYMPMESIAARPTSIGWQLPNSEIRITDDEGNDLPVGEAGELWFRSPSVMKGYANNPKATAETITPDGWLKSGDVALVDKDGYISITDRKKELIKYKAFQVAPAELEDVINAHPDVADCAVIGVYAKEQATELPKAYVVPKDARLLSGGDPRALIEGIHSFVAPRVAHFKYLRGGITLTAEIPKSASGKILKRKLRELESAQQAPVPKL
ncbi:AMP binding protein [Phanerochaete sordida]|uniref:AMP binding protein n=1 Tax=Phanerochaete sordida TaxID=48140 RepID=A0A9P3GAM3_9APHY|nr:AMP binding protein [Phanerochaete sordida]